ncbi:sugar phosphate isomerase/epimerase [Streptomyces sp. 1114.5]|uniref:sugar phosphate isomerase/epimerase family protein n=1 Tax=Streptomyces sp. 1114.5 TaxID=1938830 RepID=UPI000EB5D220|nr:sugar phosphate isomerase/epimerase family protein [Streptomyces sp. 1114.5]RKT19408.1 sugar phosphate isomerase/epimerase [Streptomyces sp. 1114.5]
MSALAIGYGTNGFSNHRLPDAIRVIADLGYTSVALTLDHHHLDPFGPDLARETDRVAALLSASGLRCVVETGARYLLDPYRKHHPTLVSGEAGPRIDFLLRALRITEALGADCLSFWSGVREPGVDGPTNRARLVRHLDPVLAEAQRRSVRLGLEPEPGMVVQHLDQALDLRRELGGPDCLGITLDVGHCVAVEPVDAAGCIRHAGGLLVNVQLDDMLPGVHEHLEFGQGQLDLAATLAALDGIGYAGVAAVELPRHSHAAPHTARTALAAIRRAMKTVSVPPVHTGAPASSTIGDLP